MTRKRLFSVNCLQTEPLDQNTRKLPLSGLVAKDQVPISNHAQIKVNVLEPLLSDVQQVSSTKSGTETRSSAAREVAVSGTKDVRARWVRANDDDSDEAADAEVSQAGHGVEVNTEGLIDLPR